MRRKLVILLCLFALDLIGCNATRAQEKEEEVAQSQSPTPGQLKTGSSFTMATVAPLTIDQIRTNLPLAPAERFEFLRRQRKITLEAIDEASSELKSLTASISLVQNRKDSLEAQEKERFDPFPMSKQRIETDLQRAKEDLAKAEQKLENAKAKPVRTEESEETIERLEGDVDGKRGFVATVQDALDSYDQRKKDEEKRVQDEQAAIRAAADELSRLGEERETVSQSQLVYQRLLGEIDDMVNQLFIASDATNSFKLRMSVAFSILVGMVILGFFVIAWSNEDVKKTIFSNESGIQFITMFAIVIAVILFGIINVLESKELSALLGGLSGYILGRSKSS